MNFNYIELNICFEFRYSAVCKRFQSRGQFFITTFSSVLHTVYTSQNRKKKNPCHFRQITMAFEFHKCISKIWKSHLVLECKALEKHNRQLQKIDFRGGCRHCPGNRRWLPSGWIRPLCRCSRRPSNRSVSWSPWTSGGTVGRTRIWRLRPSRQLSNRTLRRFFVHSTSLFCKQQNVFI